MSIRLRASVPASCDPGTVWTQLTDWAGQGRWIPLTTVKTVTERELGVGVRVVALSGLWVGRLPLGLLDRFVVTGWTPPSTGSFGELEVLHLGPFFTGEGAFRVEAAAGGTQITATEMFSLPGGRPVEAVVRLLLPIMRRGFAASLASLAQLSEQSTRQRPT